VNEENASPLYSAVAVGAVLRQARSERGMSVLEIAQNLKLTPRQVDAIENEQFDVLPGPAFVRGFVRNYARFLGLDPAPLLGALGGLMPPQAVSLTPVRNAEGEMPTRFGMAWRASWHWVLLLVLMLGLAVAGGYGGWFEPEPSPSDATAPEVLASSVPDQPALVGPPLPEILDEGEKPQSTQHGTPAEQTDLPAPAQAPTDNAAPPAEPDSGLTVNAENPVFEFRFSGDSWVEVRQTSPTGRLLFSQMFSAGQTHRFQAPPPLAFVVGNARQVSLQQNGMPVDLETHTRVSVARFVLPSAGGRP
jgi:cytoskeleton protein RodZ